MEVVPCEQHRRDDLLGAEDMVQIGAAVILARGATAVFVERARVVLMAGVFDVEHAETGEDLTGTARARGEDAVHHIDTARDIADDVVGFADANQVAWFVFGELVWRELEGVEHGLLTLTDCEATDSVAFKADILKGLSGLGAQVFFEAALLDSEQGVTGALTKRCA